MKTVSLMLASVLALASCVQNPATGRNQFTLLGEGGEYAMGQEAAEALIQDVGLYDEKPALNQYVNEVGQRMWQVTERAAQPLQISVMDDETPNASAVPGYVNVHRGLLAYYQNEAQLAEVLGHEMGHINARHTAGRFTRTVVGDMLFNIGAATLAAASDDDAIVRAGIMAGGVGTGLALRAYGRGDELEADRLALRYMERSGYDARQAYNGHQVFQLYKAYANQQFAAWNDGQFPPEGTLANLTSTHPQTPDRLQQVKDLVGVPDGTVRLPAGVTPATPATDPMGAKRYMSKIDGLAMGPNPKYGIPAKNTLYLPRQRFIWRLPGSSAGDFLLDLAEVKGDEVKDVVWRAINPTAKVKAVLMFIKMDPGLNPAQVIMKHDGNVRPSGNWQQLQVGQGATAQTAWTASYQKGQSRARVVGIPIPTRKLLAVVYYSFPLRDTVAEDAVLKAMQSSQVLSEDKAKQLQPVRIKVRYATASDKVATVAPTMASGNVGNLNELWFRALNNLPAGTDLALGQPYKTLVDPNAGF